MRRLFGCPDIVSLTEKFLMARNFYRIFTENNPVMGDSKTFGIPEAKGLKIFFAFCTPQKPIDPFFNWLVVEQKFPKTLKKWLKFN